MDRSRNVRNVITLGKTLRKHAFFKNFFYKISFYLGIGVQSMTDLPPLPRKHTISIVHGEYAATRCSTILDMLKMR